MRAIKFKVIILAITILVIISVVIIFVNNNDDEKDLSGTVYEHDLEITALQKLFITDFALQYSDDQIEKAILSSVVSKKGIQYCLLQLPLISGSAIVKDVYMAKVISIEKKTDSEYIARGYTPNYVLGVANKKIDPSVLPYAEASFPPIETYIYFFAIQIFDTKYKVYYEGKELPTNENGITGLVILSDSQIAEDQKPFITVPLTE